MTDFRTLTPGAAMAPVAPGTPVTLRWRKWDGSPHWVEPLVSLGADDAGSWFGQRPGIVSARPGRSFTADVASVRLVPSRPGPADWIATFHAPNHHDRLLVYVDLAHEIRFDQSAAELSAVDMDLDVIRADDERGTWIDDIDEFAEHRALFGYPKTVVAAVESASAELLDAVRSSRSPFDRAASWLARLG